MADLDMTTPAAGVPDELVHDFDLYDIPGATEDIQLAYLAIQRSAPDIFWTPRNGGHWVATRAEDVRKIQLDHKHFSHRRIVLPRMPEGTPRQIPLELDPPEHAHYRRPLMQALLPAIVGKLEGKVREVAVAAIDRFVSNGECEFVEDFAKVLPIHVFLDLVDLPIADKAYLLPIAEDSVRGRDAETRTRAHRAVADYLHKWVVERRETPGDDLLSKIVNVDIRGERISHAEAISFASLVLFGGLDTVAGMLAFFARFLADNPGHRRQLIDRLDDGAFVDNAIEELLRRHGITNTARYVAEDHVFKGVRLREGDMILPMSLLVGLDDRAVDDPLTVDFERPKPAHAAFGNGPHACPGAILARRELKIFIEEWLPRIPDFAVKPGTTPHLATGMVNGILRLELIWPAGG